jgi:hypothetical protein
MPVSLQVSISEAMTAPMLAAAIGAREEYVFSVQRDWRLAGLRVRRRWSRAPYGRRRGSGSGPANAIADRFSEFCLLTYQSELGAQPGLEFLDDRLAPLLPGVAPFLGAVAMDLALNGIETGDAFKRFAGDRCRAGCGKFVKASAHMSPTERQLDVTGVASGASTLKPRIGSRYVCNLPTLPNVFPDYPGRQQSSRPAPRGNSTVAAHRSFREPRLGQARFVSIVEEVGRNVAPPVRYGFRGAPSSEINC